jgi:hypothetical protein
VTEASPLGRYAARTPPSADALVTVRLLRVPVRLLEAGREHHDNLMREFRLLALAGDHAGRPGPARLVELTQLLGVRYGNAAARRDGDVDAALERGDDTVDLVYQVPAEVAGPLRELDALMTEADEFCRDEHLLTVQRSPAVRAFTAWYLAQFINQIAGADAVAWDGPLDP